MFSNNEIKELKDRYNDWMNMQFVSFGGISLSTCMIYLWFDNRVSDVCGHSAIVMLPILTVVFLVSTIKKFLLAIKLKGMDKGV